MGRFKRFANDRDMIVIVRSRLTHLSVRHRNNPNTDKNNIPCWDSRTYTACLIFPFNTPEFEI